MKFIKSPNFKTLCWLGLIYCFLIIAFAFSLEIFLGMDPCPLCLLQRIAILLVGIMFIIALICNKNNLCRYIFIFFALLSSILGAGLALRQIWLQHLPPELVPSCTAGIKRLLDIYPLLEVLEIAISGTGDCAAVETLFGVSLANWSLLSFIVLFAFCCWLILGQKKGG